MNTSPASEPGKKERLAKTLLEAQKKFGEGAIMRGSYRDGNVEVISTGHIGIDRALGMGWLPRGRIVEIFGPEQSGKTSLALGAVAQAQKQGGEVAFIDVDHAFDATYAQHIGVDLDRLLLAQPSTGEEALTVMERLVKTHALSLIVLDTVAGLVPESELEASLNHTAQEDVGAQARLMSERLRMLAWPIGKSPTCVVFVNQVRERVRGALRGQETTSGGRALPFYSSVRMRTESIGRVTSKEWIIGDRAKVRVVKNKVASPYGEAEFEILSASGIDLIGGILDAALEADLVSKRGAWYAFGDQTLGQGRAKAVRFLGENPEVRSRLESALGA